MASTAENIKVDPLRPADVGLFEHRVTRLDASVSGKLSTEELEDPALWVNIAGKMTMGTEVRCLADDMSFVAYGVCTFSQGSTVKIKIYAMHKLDQVDADKMGDITSDYEIKLRGPKKWCVMKKSDGTVIKEGIATQLEAMREMEDYKKALRG